MTETERGGTMTARPLSVRDRFLFLEGFISGYIKSGEVSGRSERVSDLAPIELEKTDSSGLAKLRVENARLTAELAYTLSELDEASPLTECARCRQWCRLHNMTPEEGDEWECPSCWERCNALEDAQRKALAG